MCVFTEQSAAGLSSLETAGRPPMERVKSSYSHTDQSLGWTETSVCVCVCVFSYNSNAINLVIPFFYLPLLALLMMTMIMQLMMMTMRNTCNLTGPVKIPEEL